MNIRPPRPACMIIDFGNNIELGLDVSVPRVLQERRGLPKFIARSIFKRGVLHPTTYMPDGVTMPRLYNRSLEIYATVDNTEYEQFNQSVDQNPPHLSDPPEPNFAYRLFHDAESTFWVIALFLAHAAPKGYQIETEWNRNFRIFVTGTSLDWIEIHEWDARGVFSPDRKFWQDILHPSFSTVAPMLSQMHQYVYLEWAYRPELNPEHVHEALMRLLLIEIVRIQDNDADIEFATGTRALPVPKP
ncbi:hypothetical protein RSOLAG22IIIB_08622 [Rhizoctonia solani]|uniref:Fungal-type protein kinase domain-containing protein n=1 Tax=Rhizoctonia solani TaxID=456999 RepID=A0A0K6FTW7_9AGAM|nr:hypothetical protein RSOLAG22IIIB_08622 [Rhizoctonia solani]